MRAGGILLFVGSLLAASAARADYQGENPYEPKRDQYDCDLLVVGGSSSGTAAAITAGRLGIGTIWTLRAPRDLGGLTTNAVNPDSDLPIRYIGGLALELDLVARYTTGFNVGGRHNGEGFFAPFHVFFRYARAQVDRLPSLAVLANLYPVAVEKDPATKRVSAVTFGHRLANGRRIVVRPKITIDAEIEGDVAWLAGVTMTLCREGRVQSEDPTRNEESYAGRIFTPEKKIGALIVAGGPLMEHWQDASATREGRQDASATREGSTQQPDRRPATMAWNGSVSLEDYGAGTPKSPWVLKRPPRGYDPAEFAWWEKGVFGVGLGEKHRRWNIDQYLSTVEGWRLPDGRHVLESMDIADREANEKELLGHVIRGLWHLQHAHREYRYGLSQYDFREGLAAKYRLSDFGTATNAGDAPLPGLVYMREGRRMVNDHVFGGRRTVCRRAGRKRPGRRLGPVDRTEVDRGRRPALFPARRSNRGLGQRPAEPRHRPLGDRGGQPPGEGDLGHDLLPRRGRSNGRGRLGRSPAGANEEPGRGRSRDRRFRSPQHATIPGSSRRAGHQDPRRCDDRRPDREPVRPVARHSPPRLSAPRAGARRLLAVLSRQGTRLLSA